MSDQPLGEADRRYAVQRFFDLHPQAIPTRTMYEIYDLCTSDNSADRERGERRRRDVSAAVRPVSQKQTMDLRDQFALGAMRAIVGDPMTRGVKLMAREIADSAYAVADAMMERRNK